MNNKALAAIVVVVVVIVAAVAVYFVYSDDNDDDRSAEAPESYAVDALGRVVEIPEDLDDGIVTVGSTGPLRFVSMFGVYDKVIEVDKGDITDSKNGRAYSYAYPYDSMDVATQSHSDNELEAATVESIAAKHPSVVVTNASVWNNYSENFNILSSACTVVVLMDQDTNVMTNADGTLADYVAFNIRLLGDVFGMQDRAEELVSGIQDVLDDIYSLVGSYDGDVYVAGLTIQGSNTLNTTFPTYLPFVLTGVGNAYNGGSTDNKVVLNVEDLTTMDFSMMIIDPSSSDKVAEQDSQLVMEYIYRLNSDGDPSNDVRMFVTVPIVWDSVNYDCVLACSYYVEYLVYGTLTLDEVQEKIVSVFELFYGDAGSGVLDDMTEFFVGKSSSSGQEMPLLGEVTIVRSGSGYAFTAVRRAFSGETGCRPPRGSPGPRRAGGTSGTPEGRSSSWSSSWSSCWRSWCTRSAWAPRTCPTRTS